MLLDVFLKPLNSTTFVLTITVAHVFNQTEIATEEFCLKSLLQKRNEINFIESHIRILLHLKIVQST